MKLRQGFCFFARIMSGKRILMFLCGFILLCGRALAQTNERIYEELDFRFVTPGARAIAMGKTFVGLADDATAAFSNPAGLSNLLEQEISFELITTQIKHHRFVPSVDSETKTFEARVQTPSFFSYAYPRGDFTFSVFRNVVQNYKEKFEFPSRFIPSIGRPENGVFGKIRTQTDNYGLGLSYVVSRHLSIGGSVVVSHLDVDTVARTGPPAVPHNGTDTSDSGTRASGIVGVLYKPNRRTAIGAVFNGGSTFHLETTLFGVFTFKPGDARNLNGVKKSIDYVIPSRFAIGASRKFGESTTIALDISRIFYSEQVTKNFLILDFVSLLSGANYFIDDVTEVHVGGEYRIYGRNHTFALRAGLFTDPDHQLHFRALPDTDPFAVAVMSFRFNSLRQRTDVGLTFGGGWAIANKFQIDTAFSFSRDANEVVLSGVLKL